MGTQKACNCNLMDFFLQNPATLVKAQEEIDRVLQGRLPTYENIKELKYLTRCIYESLRLYPHPPVSSIFFYLRLVKSYYV